MLLGTHHPRLDEKGRLFLPARFREELAEGVVLTKGQERCLYAFPLDAWARITEGLKTAPVTGKQNRDVGRVLFASASHEVPDKQGRIVVPAPLRTYAGLTKDCAVIGANTRVEIWDAAAWAAWLPDAETAYADLAQEVMPGVL